jgi:hypothetical protein
MRSQVPLGRETHASGFLSVVTWLWQAFVEVAQSFAPAFTTPAHCSMAGASANAVWPTAMAPNAMKLEMARRTVESVLFIEVAPVVSKKIAVNEVFTVL